MSEPVETPVTQEHTLQGEQLRTTPNLSDAPETGCDQNSDIRHGRNKLLNATAVRAISVRNDADMESHVNASIRELRTQVEGQQNANDALMGEVRTLRQDINWPLERLGSVATATAPAQQRAVTTPEEVANNPDTQPSGEKQDPVISRATVTAAALAAPPQQAETTGIPELIDRLARLEKARSGDTGNSDSNRSKKGTKANAAINPARHAARGVLMMTTTPLRLPLTVPHPIRMNIRNPKTMRVVEGVIYHQLPVSSAFESGFCATAA